MSYYPDDLGSPIFAEEFNNELSVWDIVGNPHGVWRNDYGYGGVADYKFNDELQYYTGPYFGSHSGNFNDGNYRVEGGVLTLIARRTDNIEIKSLGVDYTSGLITTRGLEPWFGGPTNQFSLQYGYIEMRADLSDEPGAWNALWLLPADYSYAEVDIVESVGREGGLVWQAVHGASDEGRYAAGVNIADSGYHTFGFAWTPDTLSWYVDGVETWSRPTPSDMHQPMVLLANLAVGGSWAGTPDFGPDGVAEMKIDYIRAYALPGITALAPASSAPPVANVSALASGWQIQSGADAGEYLHGGEGQDYVSGGGGADLLAGGRGFDFLNGNQGDDTLQGDAGNDTLRGGQGDDSLSGGDGSDWLSGDRDSDTMSGGGGADIFHHFDGAGSDVVIDFNPLEDRIQLDLGAVYSAVQSSAGVTVSLNASGDTLLLMGVSMTALQEGWVFVA